MQLLSYTNKTLLSSTMSLHGAQILVFQDAIRKHEYKIWVCAAPKLHLNMCSRGKSGKYPYSRTPQDMDGTLTLIFAKLETT